MTYKHATEKCSIDGCEKPLTTRGWCQAHYAKWRKYGDPLHSVKKRGLVHGTLTGYAYWKCRCSLCLNAQRSYYDAWHKNNPEAYKRHNLARFLRRAYNMEISDYEDMLEAQGGLCAICGDPPGAGARERLCVDHCHESGQVRGLLCVKCNSALGMLQDSVENARAALSYLEQHVALKVVA